MSVREVSFPTHEGPMRGWLAMPKGAGPHRAVLVIHEIHGLIENQRAILKRFAAEGYVAFAPDLYDKDKARALCVASCLLAMDRGKGAAVEDLKSATAYLCGLDEVDEGAVAVAGFCMGGGFALLMALHPSMRAAAPFYGMSRAYLPQIDKSCPVVASFGGKDRVFRKPAQKLKRALEAADVDHDLKVYPEAGHSFMTAPIGGAVERASAIGPMKVAYDPRAASDAWKRILTFFDAQLSAR